MVRGVFMIYCSDTKLCHFGYLILRLLYALNTKALSKGLREDGGWWSRILFNLWMCALMRDTLLDFIGRHRSRIVSV